MPNFDIFPSQLILKRTNNIYYWRMFANRKVSVCDMALLFGDTANIFFQMRPYLRSNSISKQRRNAIPYDARAIADVLEKRYNYKVLCLLDEKATSKNLSNLLENLQKQIIQIGDEEIPVEESDRVLFYFAGHGIAQKAEERQDKDVKPAGYLMPQDSQEDKNSTWLPMQELHDALTDLKCRHLLIILERIWSEIDGKVDYETECQLADKVGWRLNGKWLHYSDITFSLDAPQGHLPTTELSKLPLGWCYLGKRPLFRVPGTIALTRLMKLQACYIASKL